MVNIIENKYTIIYKLIFLNSYQSGWFIKPSQIYGSLYLPT